MVELLRSAGAGDRVAVLDVPGDLNDWMMATGERFPTELAFAVATAGGLPAVVPPTAAIDNAIETIWYRHVLVDDVVVAQANAERIAAALQSFRDGRPPPVSTAATAVLDADLGDLAYRFALGDDRAAVAAHLDHAHRAIHSWTADLHQEPAAVTASQETPALALARAAATAIEPAGLSLGVGR